MVKIKGTDFKTVELPDLKDRVYFGQEKVFSGKQYAMSNDLSDAIKSGKLLVLEHIEEGDPHFIAPPKSIIKEIVAEPAKEVTPDPGLASVMESIKILNEQIAGISKKLNSKSTPTEMASSQESELRGAVKGLFNKMEDIQKSLDNKETLDVAAQLSRVEDAVKGLKVTGNNIRSVEPNIIDEGEAYVPSSFNVSDMANNLSLKTKKLSGGGSMNDALNKLKNLKKN